MKRGEIARLARAAKRVPFSQPGNADYTPVTCFATGCKTIVLVPVTRPPLKPGAYCSECCKRAGLENELETVQVSGVEVVA